jgi:hypothetical protein
MRDRESVYIYIYIYIYIYTHTHFVNYSCNLYTKGVTWSAAAWPPHHPRYRPTVLFRDFLVSVLSFPEGKHRGSFKKYYLIFYVLKINEFSNCVTWSRVCRSVYIYTYTYPVQDAWPAPKRLWYVRTQSACEQPSQFSDDGPLMDANWTISTSSHW